MTKDILLIMLGMAMLCQYMAQANCLARDPAGRLVEVWITGMVICAPWVHEKRYQMCMPDGSMQQGDLICDSGQKCVNGGGVAPFGTFIRCG